MTETNEMVIYVIDEKICTFRECNIDHSISNKQMSAQH